MYLMEPIVVFIAGILTDRVVDSLVLVSPLPSGHTPFGAQVDAVLVSIDEAVSRNEALDEWLDGLLFHVGKHLDGYLAVTLQHPQYRRFLLFERASSATPFEPASSSLPFLLSDCLGLSLMTCDDIHLVTLYGSR